MVLVKLQKETRYALNKVNFKPLKNIMPQYVEALFNVKENMKNLKGKNTPVLPVAKTTTYGLKSDFLRCC